MTADLVITTDMLLNMAKTYERLADQIRGIPADLPVSVNAGIATDIIIDMLGTLDFAGTTFIEKSDGCAERLRTLVKLHGEEEQDVTLYFRSLRGDLD